MPEAFADAIIDLVSQKDKAKKMGERGKQRVKNQFTFNEMVKKYEALYQSLIGN